MSPKHQIYLDRAEFVRSLLNDTTTANILLRVDNFHIYAHTTILYCASGFFKKIFKILAHKDDERRIEYLFHDYSCNKEIAITRLHEYKGQENVELLYDRWNEQRWHVILRVSKWLGLKKLRCRVLQYVYNRGELMFQ
ncbi:2204_t:CDS:2, partial [Funneliformis mosseae]